MQDLQLPQFFPLLDKLQSCYGDTSLRAAYGAGCIKHPKICMIFMNPTARTLSTLPEWPGLRAPWIGTKNIWKLFYALKLITKADFSKTQTQKLDQWTPDFALHLYQSIAAQDVYVTSMGKCAQLDARPLPDEVFRAYLEQTYEEILLLQPQKIVTFGNQVSSILLQKKVSVSQYEGSTYEDLAIRGNLFSVYPTYYPVGLGLRNIDKAIGRVGAVMAVNRDN